jgi:hypothetical protein
LHPAGLSRKHFSRHRRVLRHQRRQQLVVLRREPNYTNMNEMALIQTSGSQRFALPEHDRCHCSREENKGKIVMEVDVMALLT